MKVVKQKEGESRKDYLYRVSIAFITDETVFYDGAECDNLCFLDDVENEHFERTGDMISINEIIEG